MLASLGGRVRYLNAIGSAVIVAGAGLGMAIFLALGALLVNSTAASNLANLSEALVERANAIGEEVRQTFEALDMVPEVPCSRAHRSALRKIVFLSDLIKDIGYHRDGYLVCTFGLGILPKPVPLAPADIVSQSGAELVLDLDVGWAPGLKLTVVRKGSYGLSLALGSVSNAIMRKDVAVSRFRVDSGTGQITVITGQPVRLTASDLQRGTSRWRDGRLVVAGCSTNRSACYALSSSWQQILASSSSILAALTVGGGLVGALTAAAGLLLWQRSRSLERRFYRALKRDELFLLYQPIVDARSQKIIAAEALMRWRLPDGQLVSPDMFLRIAQAARIMDEVTCLAVRQASEDLGDALRANPNLWVAINIAASDLAGMQLPELLERHFVSRGIAAKQIGLELTEHAALETQAGRDVVQNLHNKGFRIFIDDFGTGYSSLSYLKDLAIDAIKIDKSFTAIAGIDSPNGGVLAALLTMAKSLSVAVIAEGVETQSQAEFFREHNVDMLQGWLFGHPMPSGELITSFGKQSI